MKKIFLPILLILSLILIFSFKTQESSNYEYSTIITYSPNFLSKDFRGIHIHSPEGKYEKVDWINYSNPKENQLNSIFNNLSSKGWRLVTTLSYQDPNIEKYLFERLKN